MGDTAIILRDEAQMAALGGPTGIAKLRADAQRRGLDIARGWVRADGDASAPHFALATGYLASNNADSALAVLDRALARPTLQGPGPKLQSVMFLLLGDDPRAFVRMKEVTTNATPEAFRALPVNERMAAFSMSLNAAAAAGNGAEVNRVVDVMASVDPTFPFTRTPTREFMTWYATALQVAIAGSATPEQRRVLTVGTQRVSAGEEGVMAQIAATSGGVIYTGFLATRDTLFSNALRRMTPNATPTTFSDLDALEALQRGDTAKARTIAESYSHPDSVAKARLSFAGLRVVGRAEVLAAVGNLEWAARYLEALDTKRFNTSGLSEPGFPSFTRSFATRGRLYEELGNRQKALAAYEEFLRRTENGDAAIASQRRDATSAVARLRDGAR
jgi:tetratricopeptide (TPR) repeat protein